jgi:hypothetical protein
VETHFGPTSQLSCQAGIGAIRAMFASEGPLWSASSRWRSTKTWRSG